MIRRLQIAVAAAILVAAMSAPAAAQRFEPLPGRLEVTVGVGLLGGSNLGSSDATLTTSTGGALRLFSTSTTLTASPALEGRIGFPVMPQLEVEAFGSYGKPSLEASIRSDVENASDVTATETIKQYVVGGSALWFVRTRLVPPRLRPFVIGSVAYLRQLHDSDTLAVNGQLFEVGGGVKYALITRPVVPRAKTRLHALGVRVDARLQARRRGAAFDADVHYGPAAGAALFFRF